MSERLKPLNDVVFKKLFGEEDSVECLESLLSSILEFKVTNIEIVGEKLTVDKIDGKQGILDIKAYVVNSNEKINIEVQLVNQHNMIERTVFYWSKLYTENFKKGQDYSRLDKTITINILNYDTLPTQRFHSIYQIQETTENVSLTNLLEIHFIEYPKFRKLSHDKNNELHRWLLFLQEDVSEQTLKEVIEMDQVIKKADSKLKRLSEDEETRRMYQLREKQIADLKSNIKGAKREKAEEIAENLLKQNDSMSVEDVANATGLSFEKVKQIEIEVRNK